MPAAHVVCHVALGDDAQVVGARVQQPVHTDFHVEKQVCVGVVHDAVEDRSVRGTVGVLKE